ncbi:MAG: hypothetical protein IRZ16_10590 [Myxococcaceae bacterium]|nr:hypothetical protein [Myxococcaceae bacterium]
MNDPFRAPPPPLAREAAEALVRDLRAGRVPIGAADLARGKMFGVLVVEAAGGAVQTLRAFSGQLGGRWEVPGFVPPVVDEARRLREIAPGEAQIAACTARIEALENDPAWASARAELEALRARHQRALAELKAQHQRAREARARRRAATDADSDRLAQLSAESWDEDVALRRMKAAFRAERAPLEAKLAAFASALRTLKAERVALSQKVSWRLYELYQFVDATGRTATLRELFAPEVPSSGTGDCAAAKLLAFANRARLRPVAIAEFWWGAPTASTGRTPGTFAPACETKCRRLLPFPLHGVDVDWAQPAFR